MSRVREHWFDFGPGRRVHCWEVGDGPPVIYFPGNGCSSGDGRPLSEALSNHYRFIGIDLPGSQPTEWPDEEFDFLSDLVPQVGEIVRKLCEDVHVVVGHSMGGMLALQHAHRNRDRVRALVLMEGFVSLAVHAQVVAPDGFRDVRMAAEIRRGWARRKAENRFWLDAHPLFADSFWKSQHEHDARSWVADLDLPIQVFIGDLGQPMPQLDDRCGWLAHLGMEGVRKLEIEVVPRAGHWMMLDDPYAMSRTVRNFLSINFPGGFPDRMF